MLLPVQKRLVWHQLFRHVRTDVSQPGVLGNASAGPAHWHPVKVDGDHQTPQHGTGLPASARDVPQGGHSVRVVTTVKQIPFVQHVQRPGPLWWLVNACSLDGRLVAVLHTLDANLATTDHPQHVPNAAGPTTPTTGTGFGQVEPHVEAPCVGTVRTVHLHPPGPAVVMLAIEPVWDVVLDQQLDHIHWMAPARSRSSVQAHSIKAATAKRIS